jgi:hypothetical protein
MDPIDTLAAGIQLVDEMLDEDALEPDPGRDDWGGMKVRLGMVRERLVSDVFAVLDAALAAAEDDRTRGLVKQRVAMLCGAAAAAVYASGDVVGAEDLLRKARDLATDDRAAELAAGFAEPRAYTLLEYARWLLYHRRRADADRVAKAVIRETRAGALIKAARAVLHAPRPIESAPSLFRINGCGVGLYGERDRDKDGWYVATYFICLLFIPVFPLAAYRVRQSGGNAYQFVAKERLGPVARAWQVLVAGAAALAIGWGGVTSYLDSPERKARVALSAAQKAEARGDREAALAEYSGLLKGYAGHVEVGPAALAVIRLAAAAVPDPCTVEAVDKVGRVTAAFQEMPPAARVSAAGDLVDRLVRWADQIGDQSPERILAALTVLDMALKVAEDGGSKEAVDTRRGRLTKALADAVVAERPLQALALYVRPPAELGSLDAAAKIVAGLGKAPSLWIEAERDVLAWAAAADRRAGLETAARQARGRVQAAHEAQTAEAPLVESGDEKSLAAAFKTAPDDQEIAVALAQQKRRRGDLKGALATLGSLGPPGRMTALAQMVFAACLSEAGDLARADAVLTGLLGERLPAFQEAQRAFNTAAERTQEDLIAGAKAGRYDTELELKMRGASEAEKGKLFRDWLSERIQGDKRLGALREEFLRHEAVVPASLSLGQIKLRRAHDASGEERRVLLAAAEQTFLSIRSEAEGNPSYHLGLGQVYHRLGRTEEGNVELKRILDRQDPELNLAVAGIYRDLGLPVQAKQVAEQVWNSSADKPFKQHAASLLSHLVNEINFNEEEEEMWLKRADASSPSVQQLLLRIEARRLDRQGKLAEADRAFARLIAGYERDAPHDSSAANNAAVSYLERYQTSGDPAHLRAAVKHLDAAHRLDPQNALVTGNLAGALSHLGEVTALDHWVKTAKLPLGSSEASWALLALAEGPLREEVLGALRKDPSFHRSLDVSAEEQALAPQKPDGYERVLAWLSLSEDEKGLVDLEKRLSGMPPFDASAVTENRRIRREKTKDAFDKAIALQAATRAEAAAHRVEGLGHAPTLAVAWMVVGHYRAYLASLDPTPENLDGAVAAVRKAAETWAEGGLDEGLPGTLATVGVLRTGPESPPVAKVLAADGRIFGAAMLMQRAISGEGGADALAALRRRPELQEAARLRKGRLSKRPTLLDPVLAKIAGDAEMESAAAAVFARRDLAASLAIEARMAPGQEMEAFTLAFFHDGGKAR